MKTNAKILFLTVCLLLLIPGALADRDRESQELEKSCSNYVQGFYDWYMLHLQEQNFSLISALKSKKYTFSPELSSMLKEDFQASSKSPNEIVSLDFDPFLNAQEVVDRYEAGEVRVVDKKYLVDLYSIWQGRKSPQPDVVPQLVLKNGRWLFTNFYYGKTQNSDNDNLVDVLKSLRAKRQKSHR